MENINQLRKLHDQIEGNIRNLEGLGIMPESYGALLIPVLTEKLPEELKMIIARKFEDTVWNLKDMMKYFKSELQAKERYTSISAKKTKETKEELFTTSAFASGSNGAGGNESKSVCVYCRKPHHSP